MTVIDSVGGVIVTVFSDSRGKAYEYVELVNFPKTAGSSIKTSHVSFGQVTRLEKNVGAKVPG